MTEDDLRLLVVDDDDMQLELLQRGLGREGFVIETSTSVADALARVASFAPDLVLVDVNMPGMSNDDLGGFVKVGGGRARVLLFSAADGSHLRSLAARLGADGWLSKGAAFEEIARELKRTHGLGRKTQLQT